MLISRNLLEIELNGVHFWRLCILELFEAKIQIFFPLFLFSFSRLLSTLNFRFNRGYNRVIFTRSLYGEFKELLISRNLLEIELDGIYFWRLCFLELFEAKTQFYDQKMFYIFLHHSGVFFLINFDFISLIIIGLKSPF